MKAFYPGSFDPFTVGHMAIVCKIFEQYDELIIAVGINEDKTYPPLFGPKYRVFLIENALGYFCDEYQHRHLTGRQYTKSETIAIEKMTRRGSVKVITFSGMQVDAAYRSKADVIIRGERDNKDREFEQLLALANQGLLETRGRNIPIQHIACPEEKYTCVSSSAVKKLCAKQDYVYAASLLPLGFRKEVLCRYLRKDFVRLCETIGCDETEYAERCWFDLLQSYNRNGMHDFEALAYRLNYLRIYQEETNSLSMSEYSELALAIFYGYYNSDDSVEAIKESARSSGVLSIFCENKITERVHNLIVTQRGIALAKVPKHANLLHDIIRRPLANNNAYSHQTLSSRYENPFADAAYAPERIAKLEKLTEEKLFCLPYFHLFENDAMDNLKKELAYWQNIISKY